MVGEQHHPECPIRYGLPTCGCALIAKQDAMQDKGTFLQPRKEAVDHPSHYGGASNPYEAIKVIEAWKLDFHTGNAVKYIARAGKKDPAKEIEDLQKAMFYINRKIELLKSAR